MDNKFDQYNRYVWHLIRRMRIWGYVLSRDDIEDIFQEAHLAAFQADGLDESSTLKSISKSVFSAFHFIVDKSPTYRPVELPSWKEPSVDPGEIERIVRDEQFDQNIALLQQHLTPEEVEYISKLADRKVIASLHIPHSGFVDIRNKLAYLRAFEDHMLPSDKKEAAMIYTEVLLGTRQRFPFHFRDKHAAFLVRYLFDNVLEQDPATVNQHTEIFRKYKLAKLVQSGIMPVLRKAYPEKPPWEFSNPRLTDEMIVSAMDYVAEQEGMPIEKLERGEFTRKYPKLCSLVRFKFGGLSNLLKREVSKSDLIFAPVDKNWKRHDSDEYAHQAMDFLVQRLGEDYQVEVEDIPYFFAGLGLDKYQIFKQYKLNTMFQAKFQCSIYKAFDFHYPGRFQPWQFGGFMLFRQMSGETREQRAGRATRWFVENVLKFEDPRDVVKYRGDDVLRKMQKHGLRPAYAYFKGSLYKIFDNAYPELFKPTDFYNPNKRTL